MPILNDIAKERERFIDSRQDMLSDLGRKLQEKILDALVKKFVDEFETDHGRIRFNNANIGASAAVQIIFKEFVQNEQLAFVTKFVEDIQKITSLNSSYYGQISQERQRVFQATAEKVKRIMEIRLGINSTGKLTKGGFLESFVTDTTLRNKVRDAVNRAVTNEITMRDLITDLRYNVVGAQGVVGPIVAKYQSYVFDVYQQHDRATSKVFATDLGLEAFIYAGGLIDTSRVFCQKRNAKVWTLEEAKDWINDPSLPMTVAEREAGKIVNYDPVIDCGRWRCRHHINFIPTALALKMRADLKLAA